jgi:hypothetical protein
VEKDMKYTFFIRKSNGKWPFGKLSHKQEFNINKDLSDINFETVYYTELTWNFPRGHPLSQQF